MTNKPSINVLLSLLAAAVLLVFAMPRTAKFSYDYKKGSPWVYETLFAQFDFPILKTEDRILEEGGKSLSAAIPYYRYSTDIVNRSLRDLEGLNLGDVKGDVAICMREIFTKGILPDDGVKNKSGNPSSDVIYIQKDKRAGKHPVSEVYKLTDARARLLADVTARTHSKKIDSLFREFGVYNLIVPNLVFDKQTTDLMFSENANDVATTDGYVSAGQLIVSNGEIVTSEIAQVLDSYKLEYEQNVGSAGPVFLVVLGNIMVALLLLLLLYLAIYFTKPHIVNDSRFYYILTIFLITSLAALIVGRIGDNLLFMVPFTLAALYLQAFFRNKVILPVYAVSLLPLLIYSRGGVMFYTMFLLAGFVSIYCFQYFNKGWKQFVTAFVTFVVLALVFLAFKFSDLTTGNVARRLAYLFVSAMLTVAGYPLIYLFEKLFNLVSSSRLIELSDTSNKLLRDLEKKAPGTLQHSLQVMNMADAVARAIDANTLLVRAGALYHDIGKMANPQCFIENESLMARNEEDRYHSGLSPLQSARDIIRHVTDGVEMAQKSGLPKVVTDFILTHHGTSTMNFFYSRYLAEGGSPDNENEFRYKGRKPSSKEQIILMLCDSIEAASRTLQDYSQESFSEFVDRMVESKMSQGQMDDADISIRELGIVKKEIKTYLSQMYHERVVYPGENQKSK